MASDTAAKISMLAARINTHGHGGMLHMPYSMYVELCRENGQEPYDGLNPDLGVCIHRGVITQFDGDGNYYEVAGGQ